MIDASEITTREYNIIYRAIEQEILPDRHDGTPDIRIARAAQRVVRVLSKTPSTRPASHANVAAM